MAAALQHRHARAALAQLFAGLNAGRDGYLVPGAIEPRNLDGIAERSAGKTDRHAGDQCRAIALEHAVAADVDKNIKIARRRPERSGLALTGQANAGAGIDARRDLHI